MLWSGARRRSFAQRCWDFWFLQTIQTFLDYACPPKKTGWFNRVSGWTAKILGTCGFCAILPFRLVFAASFGIWRVLANAFGTSHPDSYWKAPWQQGSTKKDGEKALDEIAGWGETPDGEPSKDFTGDSDGDPGKISSQAQTLRKELDIPEGVAAVVVSLVVLRVVFWAIRKRLVERETMQKAIARALDLASTVTDVGIVASFVFGVGQKHIRELFAVVAALQRVCRKDPKDPMETVELPTNLMRGAGLGYTFSWCAQAKRYRWHVVAVIGLLLVAAVASKRFFRSQTKKPRTPKGKPKGAEVVEEKKDASVKASDVEDVRDAVSAASSKTEVPKETTQPEPEAALMIADPLAQNPMDSPVTMVDLPRVPITKFLFIGEGPDGQPARFKLVPDDGVKPAANPEVGGAAQAASDRKIAKKKKKAEKKKAPAKVLRNASGTAADDKAVHVVVPEVEATPEKMIATPSFDLTHTSALPLFAGGAQVGAAGHVNHMGHTMVVTIGHNVQRPVFWDEGGKLPVVVKSTLHTSGAPWSDSLVELVSPTQLPRATITAKLTVPTRCVIVRNGQLSTNEVMPSEGHALIHKAATVPGWSGSLIFGLVEGAWCAVGVHGGYLESRKTNWGLSFF